MPCSVKPGKKGDSHLETRIKCTSADMHHTRSASSICDKPMGRCSSLSWLKLRWVVSHYFHFLKWQSSFTSLEGFWLMLPGEKQISTQWKIRGPWKQLHQLGKSKQPSAPLSSPQGSSALSCPGLLIPMSLAGCASLLPCCTLYSS